MTKMEREGRGRSFLGKIYDRETESWNMKTLRKRVKATVDRHLENFRGHRK